LVVWGLKRKQMDAMGEVKVAWVIELELVETGEGAVLGVYFLKS
jgi:hypothetical protein